MNQKSKHTNKMKTELHCTLTRVLTGFALLLACALTTQAQTKIWGTTQYNSTGDGLIYNMNVDGSSFTTNTPPGSSLRLDRSAP